MADTVNLIAVHVASKVRQSIVAACQDLQKKLLPMATSFLSRTRFP